VSGRLDGSASFETSKNTSLSLKTSGLVTPALGLRAEEFTANPDPFASNRLQYVAGQDIRFGAQVSERMSLTVGAGYAQAGALAADAAEAVGIDTHAVRGNFMYSLELTSMDTVSAELGARYTRYAHAITDTSLKRGSVDAPASTLILRETHDFSPNLRGKIGAGLTVATEPDGPERSAMVSPEAQIELTYTKPSYDILWGYSVAHTSLGSRIGDGQSYAGWLTVASWPFRGKALRDFSLRGFARLSHGTTSIGLPWEKVSIGQVVSRRSVLAGPRYPLAASAARDPQVEDGSVQLWMAVAGAGIQVPVLRGISLTSGVDMEVLHLVTEPAPPGQPGVALVRFTATAGFAGVLSTDPASSTAAGRGER
jgi:hypothetical protein